MRFFCPFKRNVEGLLEPLANEELVSCVAKMHRPLNGVETPRGVDVLEQIWSIDVREGVSND